MRTLAGLIVLASLISGCSDDSDEWRSALIDEVRVLEDGRALQVGLHCSPEARVTLIESNSDSIRLRFEVRGERRGDCADVQSILLEDPLGPRSIVDDSTGSPITPEQGDP